MRSLPLQVSECQVERNRRVHPWETEGRQETVQEEDSKMKLTSPEEMVSGCFLGGFGRCQSAEVMVVVIVAALNERLLASDV